MNLAGLRALVAVTESGSFTAAASQLGLSQSAVSQAIRALERELEVTLVNRGRRGGPAVTPVGAVVVRHAQEVLSRLDVLRREARTCTGAEGRVRLGCFPSVATAIVVPLLRQLDMQLPGVDVVVVEGTDPEIREWLHAETIEAGVLVLPAEEFDVRPLGQDEWAAVLPQDHPLSAGDAVSLAAFAAEPFILARSGCERQLLALFAELGLDVRPKFEVRSNATMLALVRERLGISVAPSLALPTRPGQLAVRPLVPRLFRSFGLATRCGLTASPALTAVLAFLEARGTG
jgi:molybdate transport repressor ModE-like protein